MALWYSQSIHRVIDTGKFRPRTRIGTEKSSGSEYRGWSYHFVSHRTGASVARTLYSVSILDPYQNRVAYLRDYSDVQQAAEAAREWIDHTLSLKWPQTLNSSLGSIPELPTQEAAPQEK